MRSFGKFPALSELQAFIAAKEDIPFDSSELYSSKVDAKIVDLELRQSKFRVFQDREIFDLVDQTVQWLSETDQSYAYQLRRDDITETRYEKGGHFLKHKDYLSVTSNLVEEFTLILCITPLGGEAVEGGETIIYPYASEKGVAFDTTTPGSGLLFRKDLEHAGDLLKAGEKHILTANIWATRKQVSDQVLFVTFPAEVEEHSAIAGGGAATAVARLKEIASQDTSYALPVDCLKGTMLDAHVRFVNQNLEQNNDDLPKVVTYSCTDFTFEEFGTVVKILLRSYVHEDDINRHAHAIEFFGPFAAENLLVNLAVEQPDADPEKTCTRFVQPKVMEDKKLPAKKLKSNGDDKQPGKPNETEDFGVIVCENESRAEVVYQAAQQLGLDCYVPFKMIFVQGHFLHGYYDNYVEIPVTPVGLAVGDYDHIFAAQKVGGQRNINTCSLKKYHTKHYYFSDPNPVGWDAEEGRLTFEDEYEDDMWEARQTFHQGARGLGLKLALGEGGARRCLAPYVLEDPASENVMNAMTISDFNPLSRYLEQVSDDESDAEGEGVRASTNSLFHRDMSGKATFTWQEADAASNYIAAMALDERVKACKFH